MDTRAWVAANLTARLLAEPWTPSAIADAVNAALGAPIDWRRQALIDDLFGLAYGTYPPSPRTLTTYLTASEYFRPRRNQQVAIVLDPPVYAPLTPFLDLPIPALATQGDLAAWLNETPQQLDWLSDDRRGHGKAANPHFRGLRGTAGDGGAVLPGRPRRAVARGIERGSGEGCHRRARADDDAVRLSGTGVLRDMRLTLGTKER